MYNLKEKKLFVFDMDGTIYLGDTVFPAAVRLIKRLRSENKKVLFFTNNASLGHTSYMDKLTRLGFEPREEEILTSGDVTVEFIKKHRQGKSVYLVGTSDLNRLFADNGIPLTDGSSADITVTSLDLNLTYEKLRRACLLVENGSEFFSTHPDLVCPTDRGNIPDSGSIAALITAATGKEPTFFGKPSANAAEAIYSHTGISKEDIVIVGDRLSTDIATGKKNGFDSALVLTGVTSSSDLNGLEASDAPDMVFGDTSDIERAVFGNILPFTT